MPLDQDPIEERAEGEMSFLDHLEELRWHVVRAVIAIIICTIIGFIYVDWVFENVLLAPAKSDFLTWRALCRLGEMINNPDLCIKDIPLTLQSRFMTGQFTVMIVSALVLGLVLAFPYVIWELWRFIRPGLYSRERKNSRGVVGAITFLFILGISFGFYVVSPLMVYIMVNFKLSDLIVNEFDVTSYVTTVVSLIFGTGLLFQLPVVIFFLSKIGLVTPSFLRTYRKHAIVIILIVAAIITPPDVLSQVLITLPLYLLFEISILISARVERNKQREEAEELLKEQQSSKV
jgi:sec-independent protein translocase protein TatC